MGISEGLTVGSSNPVVSAMRGWRAWFQHGEAHGMQCCLGRAQGWMMETLAVRFLGPE